MIIGRRGETLKQHCIVSMRACDMSVGVFESLKLFIGLKSGTFNVCLVKIKDRKDTIFINGP